MARKRFTDADKWEDGWFGEQTSLVKLFWLYLLDRCDNAGVWEVNWRLASFHLGSIDPTAMAVALGNRIHVIGDGRKWFVAKFVTFQYGPVLKTDIRPHMSVIRALHSHGIDLADHGIEVTGKGYPLANLPKGICELHKGYAYPQDKDKDKDSLSLERDPRENPFPETDDPNHAGPVLAETRTDRINSMGLFVRWKVSDEAETKAARVELDALIVERGKANVRRVAEMIAKREGRKAYVNELSKEFLASDQVRSPPVPPPQTQQPDTVRITRKPKPCPIPPKMPTTLSSAPSSLSSSMDAIPPAGPPFPT